MAKVKVFWYALAMKYIGLACIVIVLYFCFYSVRIFYFSRFSPNPSIRQNNRIFGSGELLRYVAAGDSTAVGIGASSAEQTYPHKLAEFFSQNRKVEYYNVAVTGAKTQNILERQVSQIIAYQPDLITISMGGNDATHLVSQKNILTNFQQIIDTLSAQTHARIYITNMPNFNGANLLPWWYISILEKRSGGINQGLKNLNNERVTIVDVHDFGWDSFPDRAVTYSLDHFHPNDTGYQNWTNAFLESLGKDKKSFE